MNGAPPGLPATSRRGAAVGLFYGLQQKIINDRADRQLKQMMEKIWRYSEAERHREGLLSGLIVLARYERRSLFDGSIRSALGAREVCTAPDFVTAQQRWNWLAAEVGQGRQALLKCYPGPWQEHGLKALLQDKLQATGSTVGGRDVEVPYYLRHFAGR